MATEAPPPAAGANGGAAPGLKAAAAAAGAAGAGAGVPTAEGDKAGTLQPQNGGASREAVGNGETVVRAGCGAHGPVERGATLGRRRRGSGRAMRDELPRVVLLGAGGCETSASSAGTPAARAARARGEGAPRDTVDPPRRPRRLCTLPRSSCGTAFGGVRESGGAWVGSAECRSASERSRQRRAVCASALAPVHS